MDFGKPSPPALSRGGEGAKRKRSCCFSCSPSPALLMLVSAWRIGRGGWGVSWHCSMMLRFTASILSSSGSSDFLLLPLSRHADACLSVANRERGLGGEGAAIISPPPSAPLLGSCWLQSGRNRPLAEGGRCSAPSGSVPLAEAGCHQAISPPPRRHC